LDGTSSPEDAQPIERQQMARLCGHRRLFSTVFPDRVG
jgi:hypothetical protein